MEDPMEHRNMGELAEAWEYLSVAEDFGNLEITDYMLLDDFIQTGNLL